MGETNPVQIERDEFKRMMTFYAQEMDRRGRLLERCYATRWVNEYLADDIAAALSFRISHA